VRVAWNERTGHIEAGRPINHELRTDDTPPQIADLTAVGHTATAVRIDGPTVALGLEPAPDKSRRHPVTDGLAVSGGLRGRRRRSR
jgi:hypothetical protein